MTVRDDKRFALAAEAQVVNLAANSNYRIVRSYLSADGRRVEFDFEPIGNPEKPQ